jgi:hypothetical protein
LETDEVLDEPAVDRWQGSAPQKEERADEASELPFFRLSGGLMRSTARTSNRIDGLLMRMMEHPTAGVYRSNIDGNLDYLFTSLQLDMIGMAADSYGRRPDEGRGSEQVQEREETGLRTSAPLADETEK